MKEIGHYGNAPAPKRNTLVFQEYLSKIKSIFVLYLTFDMSSTYRNAMIVALDFCEADIYSIETGTVVGGLANLALLANQLVQSGLDTVAVLTQINLKR